MKRFLPLFFILLSLQAFAQPKNDDCADADTITLNSQNYGIWASGNTILATATVPTSIFPAAVPACWGTGIQNDVWYYFKTPVTANPLDWQITVTASTAGAFPQVALYRGNCNTLLERACFPNTVSPITGGIVTGLTSNTEFWIRVQDSLNNGIVFDVEVSEYCPPVILDATTTGGKSTTSSCTIFDSGGDAGDYGPNEDFYYQICPDEPHSCVILNITNYAFETCPALDRLNIYRGEVSPPFNPVDLWTAVFDQGSQIVTVPDSCVTIRFQSDGSIQDAGFELTWNISNSCPPPPPPSDCDSNTTIAALPYTQTSQTTCGSVSDYNSTDACGTTYMEGEDVVYAYTTNGNECISVTLANTSTNVGVFVLDGCPNSDAANCIASSEAALGNPSIQSVNLEDSGTYYIVVASQVACATCTGYDIDIQPAPCPIDVDPNVTDSMLVATIASQGVLIDSISLNCPQGAYGTFEGGLTVDGVPLNGGIILCNGTAEDAEGPNLFDNTSTAIGTPGDADLTALAGVTTQDACVLEFKVYVPDSSIQFKYLFGSEEYEEWVNSAYNDIFAFYISGDGIPTPENLAVVPGLATPTPITINSINQNTNNTLYNPNPVGSPEIEYDGYTDILTAFKDGLTPCTWYDMKLVIADGTDNAFDSGILIEAESLFTNVATISEDGANVGGQVNAAENCADGSFTIDLSVTNIDTTVVQLYISGTATNGVDYQFIPDSIILLPGQSSFTLPIVPTVDGIAEGVETVTVGLFAQCNDQVPFDSATIIIRDELIAQMPDTLFLCGGPEALPLTATGADFITWTPNTAMNNPFALNPLVFPQDTITYNVSVSNGVCDTMLDIFVIPTTLETFGDTVICQSASAPGIVYTFGLNSNAESVSNWTWNGFGINNSSASTIAVDNLPVGRHVYQLEFTNAACGTIQDSVVIEVLADPQLDLPATITVCEGESVDIGDPNGNAGYTYSWSSIPGVILTNANSSNPSAVINDTTQFTVLVENTAGGVTCSNTFSTTMFTSGGFTVDISPDTTINQGSSIDITTTLTPAGSNGIASNVSYTWSPASFLSASNVANPVATPDEDITYTVTVDAGGCIGTADINITVIPPTYAFPNAFTPNNDGRNDFFRLVADGGIVVETLRVFDRWGELVFVTEGCQANDTNCRWDGSQNGKALPQDTYIYQAVIILPDDQNTRVNLSGDVLLIR